MALKVEHDLHRRRMGRNVGLGLVLLAFVALVFGLTLVKTKRGDFAMQPPAASAPTSSPSSEPATQQGSGN